MIILCPPVPRILRMMSDFYLWVYVQGARDGPVLTMWAAP